MADCPHYLRRSLKTRQNSATKNHTWQRIKPRDTLDAQPRPAPPPDRSESNVFTLTVNLAHDRHSSGNTQDRSMQHVTGNKTSSIKCILNSSLRRNHKTIGGGRSVGSALQPGLFYTPAARFTIDRYCTRNMCAGRTSRHIECLQ